MRKFCSFRRGFSIIEVAVVLLIMGIFAAVAAPSLLHTLLHQRAETAARRIRTDVEFMRQEAKAKSTTRTFRVLSTSSYQLTEVADLDRPNQIYTVDLSKSPYQVTGLTADFSGASEFTFSGYGIPSSGGTITFLVGTTPCLLTVDANTGKVTIEHGVAPPAAEEVK